MPRSALTTRARWSGTTCSASCGGAPRSTCRASSPAGSASRRSGCASCVRAVLREGRRVPAPRARAPARRHPPGPRDARLPRATRSSRPTACFTVELLEHALRAAVADVRAPLPDELGGGTCRWGAELDVRHLDAHDAPRGRRLPGQVRDQEHRAGRQRLPSASPRPRSTSCPCASTCAPSCAPRSSSTPIPALAGRRFGACAHALGYRGHCLTKSRRYSTTFTALRQAREQHVHEQLLARIKDPAQRASAAAATRVASFRYVGQGHITAADAFLAASAAARAREQRRLAREERWSASESDWKANWDRRSGLRRGRRAVKGGSGG